MVGDNVGSSGDIWYHTTFVYRINQVTGVGSAWTFAPFVDGAGAFHALPRLPHC